MGRPFKQGLDYFEHRSDMAQDPKLRIIRNRYGLSGYGFVMILLEDIYRNEGYYMHLSDDQLLILSADTSLEVDQITQMIRYMVEKKMFCPEKYHRYNILTSHRIQLNYFSATCQRTKIVLVPEYILLSGNDLPEKEKIIPAPVRQVFSTPENPVSTPKNPVSEPKNPVSTPESTQRREEKRREEPEKRKSEKPGQTAGQVFKGGKSDFKSGWDEIYARLSGGKYLWSNRDYGKLGKLKNDLKEIARQHDLSITDKSLIAVLDQMLSALPPGSWYLRNLSIAMISAKINEIYSNAQTTIQTKAASLNAHREIL